MVLCLTVWDSEGNKIRGLSQWDINRELRIGGLRLTEPPIIHIWAPDSERADVIQASYEAQVVKFVVPNKFLVSSGAFRIAVCVNGANGELNTLCEMSIPVARKIKPNNYDEEVAKREAKLKNKN